MAVTQEKGPICQECGQPVGNSRFCPHCGAKLQTETPVEGVLPQKEKHTEKKTPWKRMSPQKRVLVVVLSILLVVGGTVGVPTITHVIRDIAQSREDARREQERKVLEEAQQQEEERRQAKIDTVREELAQRWNAYAKQDQSGPTHGLQITAAETTDRIDFGEGWITPPYIDTEESRISVGYYDNELISENNLSALVSIFARTEDSQQAIDELRAYCRDKEAGGKPPFGADHVEISINTSGVWTVSELTLSNPYDDYLEEVEQAKNKSNNVSDSVVIACAQTEVGRILKSSATVQWGTAIVLDKDDFGRYLVYVPLEAQNSYGGYKKYYFMVIVSDVEEDGHYKSYSYSSRLEIPNFLNASIPSTVTNYQNGEVAKIVEDFQANNDWNAPPPYTYDGPTVAPGSSSTQTASASEPDNSLALTYLDGWSWEANNGDGTSATLLEILAYYFPDSGYTVSESEELGTVTIEASDPGLAIVFSSDGSAPIIPSYSAVSQEEFSALCEDYMDVLRANH